MLMLIIGLAVGFWVLPMLLGLVGAGRTQEAS